MVKAGTIDKAAYDALPPVTGTPVTPTIAADREGSRLPVGELGEGRRLTRAGRSCRREPALPARAVPRTAAVPALPARSSCWCRRSRWSSAPSRRTAASRLVNITALSRPGAARRCCGRASCSPAVTAVVGAVLGAFLAYLIVTGRPTASLRRRVVTAVGGVLAQFGGVSLAFAFIATLGLLRRRHRRRCRDHLGIDIFGYGWLFALPGLILVYTYFQIPLMVIVFLPALDGIRAAVARGRRQPGRHHLAVLAPGRGPAAAPGVPRLHCCCCSPTRSPPTRRPPPGQPGQPDRAAADPGRR